MSAGVSTQHETVLTTHALVKHYGEVKAVDGIDLDVRRGEIYGFLGRNGAGKTTTIRMLLGLVQPTAGEVNLFGERIRPGRQQLFHKVGSFIESASAYPNLTVEENLDIQRRLTGSMKSSVAEVIELFQLGHYAKRPAGKLSLGNKQRLSLARALLHKPDLLLLDEPTNSLDPAGILEVRKLLRRLADEEGITIFMSSHLLVEVAHLADRIGVVHEGRLVEELDYDELLARTRTFVDVAVSEPDRAADLLRTRLGIGEVEHTEDGHLHIFDTHERNGEIARLLVSEGIELTRLSSESENLEAHFIRLTEGR